MSHNIATPLNIQWSGFLTVGSHSGVMNVSPVRHGFLYTGHWGSSHTVGCKSLDALHCIHTQAFKMEQYLAC